jgi:UPF0042 nucleotide-binding protein
MQITHLDGRGLVAAVVRTIGFRHKGAHDLVTNGLYLDLRYVLRNPADDPAMRYLTGLHGRVYAHVLATPGAPELIARTARQLRALADEVPLGRLAFLTVVCQGGRHRSVAVGQAVARSLWSSWEGAYGVEVEHCHIDEPVLPPSA